MSDQGLLKERSRKFPNVRNLRRLSVNPPPFVSRVLAMPPLCYCLHAGAKHMEVADGALRKDVQSRPGVR
jgi:hypothetical protein